MKTFQPRSFAIVKATLLSTLMMIAGSSAHQVMAKHPNPQIVAQAAPTVQFYCGKAADPSSKSNLPATVAKISGYEEEVALVIWKSEGFKVKPQQRCEIVSPKFQMAMQQDRNYIAAGIDKKTSSGIICAVSNPEESCDRTNMLFTLKSYQDAGNTIEQLASLLSGTASSPFYQSSGTRVVDLRNFALLRKK
jgi:Circadian oscillating protein COP23